MVYRKDPIQTLPLSVPILANLLRRRLADVPMARYRIAGNY